MPVPRLSSLSAREGMKLKLNDKFELGPVIRALEKTRFFDQNGNPRFGPAVFGDEFAVLESAIRFSKELPEVERHRIVHTLVSDIGGRVLTDDYILKEAGRLQSEFLRKPIESFVFVAEVSIRPFCNTRSIGKTRIYFHQTRPPGFDFAKPESEIRSYVRDPLPTDYAFARVETRGRSRWEAFEMAISALDLLRGIWNLFLNRRSKARNTKGRPRPVNQIILGPLQTLHQPTGQLVDNSFWYDQGYRGPVNRLSVPDAQVGELQKFEKSVRDRLRRATEAERRWLQDLIRTYCRALDEENLDFAFLKLWMTLEMLTGTGEDPYAKTIKRTASLFTNPDFQSLVLETLRGQRNRLVHANESPYALERVVYRLKGYVESALMIYLENRLRVGSRSDFWQFLDLPFDRGSLEAKLRLYKKAKDLRR
jgi:hypothetical protein